MHDEKYWIIFHEFEIKIERLQFTRNVPTPEECCPTVRGGFNGSGKTALVFYRSLTVLKVHYLLFVREKKLVQNALRPVSQSNGINVQSILLH